VLLATLGACDSDKATSATPSARTVEGTYTLRTYYGQPLPLMNFSDGDTIEVVSGSLVLRRDNTYVNTMNHKSIRRDGTVSTFVTGSGGTYQIRTEYRGNGSTKPGSYFLDTTIALRYQGEALSSEFGFVRGSSINIAVGLIGGTVFTK